MLTWRVKISLDRCRSRCLFETHQLTELTKAHLTQIQLISPLQQESRTDALLRLESVPIPCEPHNSTFTLVSVNKSVKPFIRDSHTHLLKDPGFIELCSIILPLMLGGRNLAIDLKIKLFSHDCWEKTLTTD